MNDLFSAGLREPERETLAPGAILLRGRAVRLETMLIAAVDSVVAEAPFRHMVTPGGFQMSVAMTNCGRSGWITDRSGYRYDAMDPQSGRRWPAMPEVLQTLATEAASEAGYPGFIPDACLINRYEPGTRLTLHQDKNERDLAQPVVSVSLGLSATFQFGGQTRTGPSQKLLLRHGDIVVWGGPSRLSYHGVLPLRDGEHARLGRIRINLTFRKAL